MTEEQSAAADERIAEEQPGDGRPPLTRDQDHRVVAGVCGGLGRHLDIDPVVFRVVTAVLCLTGGLGLFLYGLAWLIVPLQVRPEGEEGGLGRTELQRVLTGRVDGQSIGAVLLTVIGTGVFFSWMGSGDSVLPLLLLGAMVFFAVRHDPERRRRARGLGRPPRPGGPYDRPTGPTGPAAAPGRGSASPLSDWKTWRQDFHEEWASRKAELRGEWAEHAAQLREGLATAAEELHERVDPTRGQRPRDAAERADAPSESAADAPQNRTGYLWDPRHPERDPYGAPPPPGAPAQAWWQRTDLPAGDPLRKNAATPPPPPPPERRERRARSVLAPFGLLLSVGVAWLVWSLNGHLAGTVLLSTTLATGLLGLGVTILVGARFGRARVLVVPALLVTLLLTAVGSTAGTAGAGLGNRSWAPAGASEVRHSYGLGAGDARLDLSAVDPAGRTVATTLRLGAGDATLRLPADVTVELDARTTVGNIQLPDRVQEGNVGAHVITRLDPVQGTANKGTIELTLQVGLGDIQVVQG
ncbi:PspC domain-containing protein [Kitasatospora sp. NBC_01287]|uniref:PspC domain-containing protein n=1 Tax=Kitasatospora sp. NBC_01287 TaxID=2903573 RepID=UPI00224D5D59|nr:PspC domain-containing protein [Kitasatospora sp. NBC_01287]MCX4748549.1 PspC domain-containing protein [Kitasatospora sp. NBC_01287]